MALASAQRRAEQMKGLRIQAAQAKKAELEESRQRLFEKQLLLEALQARRAEENDIKNHYLVTGEWLQRARGKPACAHCLAVQRASNSKQSVCGACLKDVGDGEELTDGCDEWGETLEENVRNMENQMVMGATMNERVHSLNKLADLRQELVNSQRAARLQKKKIANHGKAPRDTRNLPLREKPMEGRAAALTSTRFTARGFSGSVTSQSKSVQPDDKDVAEPSLQRDFRNKKVTAPRKVRDTKSQVAVPAQMPMAATGRSAFAEQSSR
ncbi:hypothetical protein CYMTET_31513 [Cymbomonas tetramitiformis]|uniref:Uncharacterized protein n=1 Tax=Cymbomonas tetramitiformis TaxID=36881 RepID=A0AAE0KT32_9CHLO|nr:hypothetical protein CYMTET_31513 [Cymbomonas tetramitiformis]